MSPKKKYGSEAVDEITRLIDEALATGRSPDFKPINTYVETKTCVDNDGNVRVSDERYDMDTELMAPVEGPVSNGSPGLGLISQEMDELGEDVFRPNPLLALIERNLAARRSPGVEAILERTADERWGRTTPMPGLNDLVERWRQENDDRRRVLMIRSSYGEALIANRRAPSGFTGINSVHLDFSAEA